MQCCYRLPVGLTQLRNLVQLSLNDVRITHLPSNIGEYVKNIFLYLKMFYIRKMVHIYLTIIVSPVV